MKNSCKCKGCGFPFPPHELRGEECPECVWKRLERTTREIERVNRFRENTARRLHEKSDALQEALAQLAILKERLERVEREAAAMREALQWIWDYAECGYIINGSSRECGLCGLTDGTHAEECYQGAIEPALHADAGRDYISKESVKPLADALSCASGFIAMTVESMGADTSATLEKVKSALAHARTLGL